MSRTIQWVGQSHQFGCMAATAAMIMGINYDQACRMLTGNPDTLHHTGLSYFMLDSRLADNGFALARKYSITQPGNRKRDIWPPKPWASVHWCEVMITESSQYAHAVVMLADGTVLDPASPMPKQLRDYAKVNFVAAVVPVISDHLDAEAPHG